MISMTLTVTKRAFALSTLLCALALFTGCYSDPNPSQRVDISGGRPAAPVGTGTSSINPASTNVDANRYSELRIGDLIVISFSDIERPPQKQEVNIPDSGIITLPFNVHVKADGKTTTQLEKDIRDAYVPSLFVNLTVSVRAEQRFYFVDGEVRQSGRVPYFGEMTVLRAISSAGGFTDFANRRKIELRRQNGNNIIIDYNKALRDAKFDPPVYPNDHIVVKRVLF